MKQVLFSLAIAITATSASVAQSTLSATSMNPVHGDVFYGHSVDTNGISKGPSGARVTWNFSTVVANGLHDTIAYVACDSTPYCSSFSGSNIAIKNEDDYIYGKASTTGLELIGMHSMGTNLVYTNSQSVMKYPFTYNSVFVDTSSYAMASVGYYHKQIDSFICDGYGTLKLPGSTDTNVLRIRLISYTEDSSSFATEVNRSRTESYNWYKPGFHNALFTVSYDTFGSATGAPYVMDVTYYTKKPGTTTAVGNINTAISSVQVYPNPATNDIHIEYSTTQNAAAIITIADLMGRVVGTIDNNEVAAGKHEVTYSVTNLPSGIYIVHLQTDAGSINQKITIAR